MLFGEIAAALGAQHRAARIALRRALDRSAAQGQLGKRARKRMYGGPRDIVWFRAD
jgi:hypothetical protein